MNFQSRSLNVPGGAAPADGTSTPVQDLTNKTVQVGGTITAGTCQLQVSMDGVAWANAQTVAAPGIYTVPHVAKFVRFSKVAGMTGTPTAILAGHGTRSI